LKLSNFEPQPTFKDCFKNIITIGDPVIISRWFYDRCETVPDHQETSITYIDVEQQLAVTYEGKAYDFKYIRKLF
jgi:hypothetical protein